MGAAAPLLGLEGQVAGDDLRAVLAGLAPDTGLTPSGTQVAAHPRRVPGYDLTLSVPKSVSVLWALGDPLVQDEVTTACEAALNESLAWLEREACFVRRGTNNRQARVDPAEFGTRRMVADGFVAARFPHRTSRLGDPHLHWHVLVANMARGIDGRWTALDGTALYNAQRSAGVLFQTAMRRELTQRLGVAWGPMHNDSAEIAGIPARLLREFSRRHDQIAEWLEITGRSDSQAAEDALLDTRPSKKLLADFQVLETEWRERARALGWGPAQLDVLVASTNNANGTRADGGRWTIHQRVWRAGESTVIEQDVRFDEWIDWLLTERVTEKSGTFTRFDLTQAVASALPVGTPIGEVERVVARALGSAAVVQVGDHWAERALTHAPSRLVPDDRKVLYTSHSLLTVERKLVNQLADSVATGTGRMPAELVTAAVSASTLGEDQAAAVLAIASAGDRVTVMVGRAGTGKTHTLGTVRSIYEAAGWDVIGLAPSARAARELEDGAGIRSTTLARHLVEQRTITATTLVVVDEAAMAGTRDLAAIVDQATAIGAKVLLVGDDRQLPEVAHGGAFRAAEATLGERVVELTINRRQRHEWERQALDQLRAGDVPTAFAAYRDHGRVILADDPADIHGIALADWLDARSTGADVLLLAGTRSEARLLNRHARALLTDHGLLDRTGEIEFVGRRFVTGDEVVLRRNHPGQHLITGEPFSVDNGMRGVVTSVSPDHMTLRITSDEEVVLERSYLERGWVDHAYANTIHTSQGSTSDEVMLVGPAGLYREGAYVAMSRGRERARIYLTVDQATEINEAHRIGIPLPTEADPDPVHELLKRINHSAAKVLVTVADPHADQVATLATSLTVPELRARGRHAGAVEQTCGVKNPQPLRTAFDTATECRLHLAEGRRVRAIDRDNVGHVMAIDDDTGMCIVHFESTDGRTATRSLDWSELVMIDHPDSVVLTPAAGHTLTTRRAAVEAAEQAWAAALAEHGVAPGDADLYRRATHAALDQAAHGLRAEQPDWLTTWLGERPATPAAAAVWDDAVAQIAHHRALHHVPADEPGLGHRPDHPTDAAHWQTLMMQLLADRLWLADHPIPEAAPLARRTPAELIQRQVELEQLMSTAPVDQHSFIDRNTHSQLNPTEMHEYLSAAMAEQDARREWILTNWPHLVELEQVTALIAAQAPLAHWPPAQPAEVQQALAALRGLAPQVDARESRTLSEIDAAERAADPVRQLEARTGHLHTLATRATGEEIGAVEAELAQVTADLRAARQSRRVSRTFDRYRRTPCDKARDARVTTITNDVLTGQPDWLVDELLTLHNAGQLSALNPEALKRYVVAKAVSLDGGHPSNALGPPAITVALQ
jgi:conjugative relaxase-like TrwC/TraI family protein